MALKTSRLTGVYQRPDGEIICVDPVGHVYELVDKRGYPIINNTFPVPRNFEGRLLFGARKISTTVNANK